MPKGGVIARIDGFQAVGVNGGAVGVEYADGKLWFGSYGIGRVCNLAAKRGAE